jgi:Tfp pilus assembly protein FimT
VELLVVIGIIGTLTLIIVPNYGASGSQLALQRSANKLSQDIERAKEMAMSASECSTCGGVPKGYGIYLTQGATTYLLYADKVGTDDKYDAGQDIVIETISFEKGVQISSISPAPLSINFKPPDPAIKISNGLSEVNETTITLSLQADASKTKIIKANKAGLIYVE